MHGYAIGEGIFAIPLPRLVPIPPVRCVRNKAGGAAVSIVPESREVYILLSMG